MNYRKYPNRVCKSVHECNLCLYSIFYGESYYDGGFGRRVHLVCNDLEGGIRFVKWMRSRKGYEALMIHIYTNGEPYFKSGEAEMSLSEFLKREKELNK